MTLEELKIVKRALLLNVPSSSKKAFYSMQALEIVRREIEAVEQPLAPGGYLAVYNICSGCDNPKRPAGNA